jgi:hypothetical protein
MEFSIVSQDKFNEVIEKLISALDKLTPEIEVTKKN